MGGRGGGCIFDTCTQSHSASACCFCSCRVFPFPVPNFPFIPSGKKNNKTLFSASKEAWLWNHQSPWFVVAISSGWVVPINIWSSSKNGQNYCISGEMFKIPLPSYIRGKTSWKLTLKRYLVWLSMNLGDQCSACQSCEMFWVGTHSVARWPFQ